MAGGFSEECLRQAAAQELLEWLSDLLLPHLPFAVNPILLPPPSSVAVAVAACWQISIRIVILLFLFFSFSASSVLK